MSEVYWSPTWDCPDCGEQVPIQPGQDTRPIRKAHVCDSFRLAVHQARLEGWSTGYKFAVEHYDEELVQADKRDGSGWLRHVGRGSVTVQVGAPVCRDCGALWRPVRRAECLECGSDAGPTSPTQDADQ